MMRLHRMQYEPPRYRLDETDIEVRGSERHYYKGALVRRWSIWGNGVHLANAASFSQARDIATTIYRNR